MRVKWKLEQEVLYPGPQTSGPESLNEIGAGHLEAPDACALIRAADIKCCCALLTA